MIASLSRPAKLATLCAVGMAGGGASSVRITDGDGDVSRGLMAGSAMPVRASAVSWAATDAASSLTRRESSSISAASGCAVASALSRTVPSFVS